MVGLGACNLTGVTLIVLLLPRKLRDSRAVVTNYNGCQKAKDTVRFIRIPRC
ncbi:colony stimulating factor 3 receptor (granulocyte) (predicted), isoform CRA_a [Rattus norvegicus]|uniref:Colony stimulating factor 3 receptor (Granulocyte) (Predicted), isoform CRA_a n=1 Tax=Rattus norvegicus TaxID=10116 RepID=A6IS83_RAT|nr:colony stimulating factor 3 receptor (granulocyte) (predicted), isoform CRA_a [Rattus norvegicus]